jgi:hypothetical protein
MNCCAECLQFTSDPRRIEAMIPGLKILGSAYASVAAGNGLCLLHDRYQSGKFGCPDFTRAADAQPKP